MRRKIDIEIKESEPELQKMIRNEQGRLRLHRLNALYIYKTGQAKTYSAIGKLLGYERHTISVWFKRYQEGGLDALMKVDKPGPKAKTKLKPSVMRRLKEKLDNDLDQFKSYKEIQFWVNDECNLRVSYSTVHSIVRYEMDIDLKEIQRKKQVDRTKFEAA